MIFETSHSHWNLPAVPLKLHAVTAHRSQAPVSPGALRSDHGRTSTCNACFLPSGSEATSIGFHALWLAPTATSLCTGIPRPLRQRLFPINFVVTLSYLWGDVKYFLAVAAYSLLRMILPLMVLGSSVRNSTMRGYLYGAVWVLTYCWISFFNSSVPSVPCTRTNAGLDDLPAYRIPAPQRRRTPKHRAAP